MSTAQLEGTTVIRTMVVEDQRTLADLLSRALVHEPGHACVGTAGTGAEALRLLTIERPDTAVVDLGLPDIDGIELCRRMLAVSPDLRIVILTATAEPRLAATAAAAGAAAFLPKDSTLDAVLAALRNAGPGYFSVDATMLTTMVERARPKAVQYNLTAREREMLLLMSRGMDPRAIAGSLNLSLHTARGYIKNLYRKLDVHSQLEAVVTGHRTGLLTEIGD